MGKIKGFLALFAALGAVFKWAPLLSFLGPVGPILAAVGAFFSKLVGWFFRGVTVILCNPVVFVVVVPIGLGAYALGINRGLIIDGYLVKRAQQETVEWKTAHQKLLDDAAMLDAKDKSKHKSAVTARTKAEANERAKIVAENKTAAPPVDDFTPRVRPIKRPPPSGPKLIGGPSVQWFYTIFGKPTKG